MKEALITLITDQLGAGNWDMLSTRDLFRIFMNLNINNKKEGTDLDVQNLESDHRI